MLYLVGKKTNAFGPPITSHLDFVHGFHRKTFFHNLGLGDGKTVVKPKKRTRGECFTECCCVPWLIGVDASGTGYPLMFNV